MSPRSKSQNLQIHDERKEQILNCALKVFARNGLAVTQIKDVAQEAGVSYGLVYHYFKSKDKIFYEVVDRALNGSRQMVFEAAKLTCDPLGKLTWLTRAVLTRLQGDSIDSFNVILQASNTQATPDDVVKLIQAKNVESMQEALDIFIEGQKLGQIIAGDPQTICKLYFSLISGIFTFQLLDRTFMPSLNEEMILRLIKA